MPAINLDPGTMWGKSAYVSQSYPDTNPKSDGGGDAYSTPPVRVLIVGQDLGIIYVSSPPPNWGLCRSHFFIDLSGIPLGSTINSAVLTLYNYFNATDSNYGSFDVNVYSYESVSLVGTWIDQPDLDGLPAIPFSFFPTSGPNFFDLTERFQAKLSERKIAFRIQLADEGSGYGFMFQGGIWPGNGSPQIDITYTEPITGRRRSSTIFL